MEQNKKSTLAAVLVIFISLVLLGLFKYQQSAYEQKLQKAQTELATEQRRLNRRRSRNSESSEKKRLPVRRRNRILPSRPKQKTMPARRRPNCLRSYLPTARKQTGLHAALRLNRW